MILKRQLFSKFCQLTIKTCAKQRKKLELYKLIKFILTNQTNVIATNAIIIIIVFTTKGVTNIIYIFFCVSK